MAIKRSDLVDNETPGFYHLISRCVRRAFLCGVDEETGISFEHRRHWIESRILDLADIFSIEIYSYAVMSNHYHLVVYFDPKLPWRWSDDEVATRWTMLYPGSKKTRETPTLQAAKHTEIVNDEDLLQTYRERLGSLSWLMRAINEPIAKRSNAEDFCKGHFFESRFKSQALLDEAAALTCMAYVDLNPIRACMTNKLEESEYTSIQHRLIHLTQAELDEAVAAIAGNVQENKLSLKLIDYIELVEWTGKNITHPDKARIPTNLSATLSRLNINQRQWLTQVKAFGSNYYRAVGALDKMFEKAKALNQQWLQGIKSVKHFYLSLD